MVDTDIGKVKACKFQGPILKCFVVANEISRTESNLPLPKIQSRQVIVKMTKCSIISLRYMLGFLTATMTPKIGTTPHYTVK